MNKQTAKGVIIISVIVMFGAFVFGISFYYRGLPNTPDPQAGRIYPLNNHGFLLYMTHREKLQQETAFIVFGVLFLIVLFTTHFVDPFDNAKLSQKSMKPWNHRWGP